PPFRPLQLLILARRRELERWGIGRDEAVIESLGDRHHRRAGEDAVAKNLKLRGLREKLDAGLAPGVANEFEHVRFFRRLAGALDDDLQLSSIGEQTGAVVVALRQAELVEQRVGALEVEPRPLLAE